MIPVKKFSDFELKENKKQVDFPEFNKKNKEKSGLFKRLLQKLQDFCDRKFGNESRFTKFVAKLNLSFKHDSSLDSLSHIKKNKSVFEQINLVLTIILIIILFFAWNKGVKMLNEIDQKKVDLKNQSEVMQMEEKNNEYLAKLQKGSNELMKKIEIVYSTVPNADEKVEEVISMLESIAFQNRMVIEAIGIRKVPDSQFYYDDLVGYVQPYEYTFSVEKDLPTILSFLSSLRSSLRIMDIITLDIDEGKGSYKANISLFVYHIIEDEDDIDDKA